MWYGNLRHEAAAVLLRHLPVQGKEKSREYEQIERTVICAKELQTKPWPHYDAQEQMIKEGGIIHQNAMGEAAEMALDGASKESLAERLKQARSEAYVPTSRVEVGVRDGNPTPRSVSSLNP